MTLGLSQSGFNPDKVVSWCSEEGDRVAALLPGFGSPSSEIRIKALYAYRSAFGNIGIKSEEALLAAAALVNDPEPKVREVARQVLIEVDSYRSAKPAIPRLLEELKKCSDPGEAQDLGRAIGCIRISPADADSPVATLVNLLEQESDLVRVGAARAACVAIMRIRGRLEGTAERLGVLSGDHAETCRASEILTAIGAADATEKTRMSRSFDIDFTSLANEYDQILKLRPALEQNLSCESSPDVRRASSCAIKEFKGDCKDIFWNLAQLSSDADDEVRANAYYAMACCPDELGKTGDLLTVLLQEERFVMAMTGLIACVKRHPSPSAEALTILELLADLSPNEARLQREQEAGKIVIGNDFVTSQALEALQSIRARTLSN